MTSNLRIAPTQASATFHYPPKIEGYRPGKSLGVNVGYGPANLICQPGSDGQGDIVRRGEVIGRLVRSIPNLLHAWTALDNAGNIIAFGSHQMDVVSLAARRLPSASAQVAFLREIDAAYPMAAE